MAINLRERKQLPNIPVPQRRIPVEQIIQTKGYNPMAAGIQQAGQLLSQAMQQRSIVRKKSQESALIAQMAGLSPEEIERSKGVDPDILTRAIQLKASQEKGNKAQQRFLPVGNGLVLDTTTGEYKTPPALPAKAPIPKPPTLKGVTPDGRPVSYDSVTKQNVLPDNTPYTGTIYPPTVGSEEQRRQALVSGANKSIAEIGEVLAKKPTVLNELKAIRLTPGRVYSQLASPEGKRLYINLRESIANEIYLKTGATANEQELENATVSYLAALNDSPSDFLMRMEVLKRNIEPFSPRAGQKSVPKSKTKTDNFDDLRTLGLIK